MKTYGFSIETNKEEDLIRISQGEEFCMIISPDEIDELASSLKKARAEIRGEKINSLERTFN
jgi:hypothetical protein